MDLVDPADLADPQDPVDLAVIVVVAEWVVVAVATVVGLAVEEVAVVEVARHRDGLSTGVSFQVRVGNLVLSKRI